MESRCAFGPESALPARTSDPAEDLRPHPRRHTVPANEMLVRLFRYANCFVIDRHHGYFSLAQNKVRILAKNYYRE